MFAPRVSNFVFAALAFTALGLTAPANAAPALVDGVAASVGRQVITLSEVEVEARLLLVQRGGPLGLEAPLDDALRTKVLEYLIVQEALVRESRRKGGVLISEGEIDRVVAIQRARLSTSANYARLLSVTGVDEERLRGIVRRDLTVRTYLDRELPSVEISLKHVDAFLASSVDFAAGETLEARRHQAREKLATMEKRKAFSELTSSIFSSLEVRRIASFAASPPSTASTSAANAAPVR